MTDIALEVRNLSVAFDMQAGQLKAVDKVSFEIAAGETVGLVGESGCGKSTLGKAVLRLIEPDSGSVRFFGRDLLSLSGAEMKTARKSVQMVFQDPFASLNPRQTVGTILTAPLTVHGVGARAERRETAMLALQSVGLPAADFDKWPHEFSGGQRQRIAIARALILNPSLVICDEPVSALDLSIQAQILNLLVDLKEQHRLSYLFVSHDLSVVRYFSDRIMVMYLGRIVEIGESQELWDAPAHPYTQALIEAAPDPARPRHVPGIRGDLPSAIDRPLGCAFHPRCPKAQGRCQTETPELRRFGSRAVACHYPNVDVDGGAAPARDKLA